MTKRRRVTNLDRISTLNRGSISTTRDACLSVVVACESRNQARVEHKSDSAFVASQSNYSFEERHKAKYREDDSIILFKSLRRLGKSTLSHRVKVCQR